MLKKKKIKNIAAQYEIRATKQNSKKHFTFSSFHRRTFLYPDIFLCSLHPHFVVVCERKIIAGHYIKERKEGLDSREREKDRKRQREREMRES